jgi:hypothetical protein
MEEHMQRLFDSENAFREFDIINPFMLRGDE